MPYIKVIEEDKAEGKLTEIYQDIIGSRGKLSNIMQIQSLFPEAMKDHLKLYKTIMFTKSNLSRKLKEMIAIVVSVANKCPYCINHHAEALNHYWKDRNKINLLISDFHNLDMDLKSKSLLEYAYKLTLFPSKISESDISRIKSYGWNDEDILCVNLIISYFNFVNRIALGLGVEFNEEEMKGYNY
ncbi:MAG TPA: peroxidase [Ignavibacteria bacterium]|nr:peroxidase [Ignavibacteria bacterium]